MNLNDLLENNKIDPRRVLVLRHRPSEPQLNKILPLLVAERPDLFQAYQETQTEKLERVMSAMEGSGYIASFIRREGGKALFVGLYSIGKSKLLSRDKCLRVPASVELMALGMRGLPKKRSSIRWFDLAPVDFYASWKGKLVVGWPPPEKAWWRRAHRNDIPVLAILEENALAAEMPEWDAIDLTWDELGILPTPWKYALSQWRGIYYIFDTSDAKGYVGSAYGERNLLGRWQNYAARGDGGNKLLRRRDPRNFQFSILQLLSPAADAEEVIRIESSWKKRLHTHSPCGLNDN